MKIVSWNCGGALRLKLDALCALQADVYIVQECENPVTCKNKEYKKWAENSLWVGTSPHKGLGIFAAKHINLAASPLDSGKLELFLPCMVEDMPLLAVWTKYANSPNFRYIGQLWKWLQINGSFLSHDQALCIGDFNSNACWDEWVY